MIDKKITLEQIRQVSKWTKDAGIEVRASFMIALPGETPEMAKKTIDFAISIDADYAQFSITTPFPETKLYEDAKKHGIVLNDFSKYNLWEPVFIPFGYKDKKEIEDIGKLAVRKFYFRPRYIIGRIKKIRSFSDFVRLMNGLSMAIGFVK
jgi:magnesium-protoporphyrin IX monomethyl ester (oxidative) cyclase